jgi:AcrR family transcriptional regulator
MEVQVSGPVRQLDDLGVDRPLRSPFEPARDHSPARQRIVDVARELFCSRGYERTPLRAISDSLGVTKAALYYHFRAKDDLLVAIVGPVLDRIDAMVDRPAAGLDERAQRREFLIAYVEELVAHADVIALLVRDRAVGEHPLGRRFAAQHTRMRRLLGAGDEPEGVIRATTALRALELAVVEFADAHPVQLRDTALHMAVAVLDS